MIAGTHLLQPRRVRFAAHRGSDTERRLVIRGLDVLPVPGRYVSSESSALVALAHGHEARPVGARVRSVDGGRDGRGRRFRPTLVLNAETVLRIHQIHRNGPAWFRSYGTDDEPGPRLVTISGDVARPGVYETAAGVPLDRLLEPAGPGTGPVHVGGLAGGWVLPEQLDETRWSRAGLAPFGFSPGAGVLHVLPAGRCPLQYAVELTRFAAGESAGQCGPCMFGLPAVADDLARAAAGNLAVLNRLQHRLGAVHGRGGCSFPDGVTGFVASTLHAFPDDLQAHARGHCHHTLAAAAPTR